MAKIKKADSTAREDVEQSELRHTGGRIKCYNLFGQWFAGFLCGLTQQLSPMCLYKRNKTHAHKKILYKNIHGCFIHDKPRQKECKQLSTSKQKAMAPHSSTLAWKIPWTEEPGRLQSRGSLRVGHH